MKDPFELIGAADNRKKFSDVLRFGKYKTWTIQEVFEEDPKYLKWCLDNVEGFIMSKKDEKKIREEAGYCEMDENDEDQFDPFWD